MAATEALAGVLSRMGLPELHVTAEDAEDGACLLSVAGPGAEELARPALLDALQYLVNRMVSRPDAAEGPRVYIDAAGYRQRRGEELKETARRLAEEVRRTGRAVSAGRLTPSERRLVHLAVAEEQGVTTRSEGEGRDRRLLVLPA
jgi:spoIIIJ-associated protein